MAFDYQQYEGQDGVGSLRYVIECADCEWSLRRSFDNTAADAKNRHERQTDHSVTITDDGPLFDTEGDDEE